MTSLEGFRSSIVVSLRLQIKVGTSLLTVLYFPNSEKTPKWAADNKAKEDKKAAEEQAKAEADALVKAENSAREEVRLLRAELFDREPEKMSDLHLEREYYEGTWAERLGFLKTKAQKWETERQSAQKSRPVTEERHEPGNNQRDDYESPSPF